MGLEEEEGTLTRDWRMPEARHPLGAPITTILSQEAAHKGGLRQRLPPGIWRHGVLTLALVSAGCHPWDRSPSLSKLLPPCVWSGNGDTHHSMWMLSPDMRRCSCTSLVLKRWCQLWLGYQMGLHLRWHLHLDGEGCRTLCSASSFLAPSLT